MKDIYGSNKKLPLILIGGFSDLNREGGRDLAYQGFNLGTVYPHKKGEAYIYEGLILRLLKDEQYLDASRVVGFFPEEKDLGFMAEQYRGGLEGIEDPDFFRGFSALQPEELANFLSFKKYTRDPEILYRSFWVFRYYNYQHKNLFFYADELYRFIEIILNVTNAPAVNLLAHSEGGFVVRSLIQKKLHPQKKNKLINKVATVGTPHKGIFFPEELIFLSLVEDLEKFKPEVQDVETELLSYKNYPEELKPRTLCVVGTHYYLRKVNGFWAEVPGKLKNACIPESCVTYIHQTYGDKDSLVRSREMYEIVSRFFFGNYRISIKYLGGMIKKSSDFFGQSEYFFGLNVKPRGVDFELFHQSKEAENCYGPFLDEHLSRVNLEGKDFGDGNLVYAGFFDSKKIRSDKEEIVFRLTFHITERDVFGQGFSDEVILHKQYYIQISLPEMQVKFFPRGYFADSGIVCKKSTEIEDCFFLPIREDGFEGNFSLKISGI
ncbi:MAG: alpha/beta hydrolase [Leptospiraceae bacterium]|nr:alpha/beta hydrolase [Leptospiraceae bacterium]